MAMNTVDAAMLQKMFLAGAKRIESKKEWINELNVFPVPDGDTGTNMSMTIMAAAKEVGEIEHPTMDNLAKAISMGALRGARGNSGVILSQLFRGFTKEIKDLEVIDLPTLSAALNKATETAYKAVMKPKEGTILTVAKGMADKMAQVIGETADMGEAMEQVAAYGGEVLAKTPELLPVLKQAGVVDSGGQGLMEIVRGAVDCFLGREELAVDLFKPAKPETSVQTGDADTADIKFGYCTEFIVNLEKPFDEKTEDEFKQFLSGIGDSIVCVWLEDIVKVHVHTNDPGLAIQKGLSYGSLTSMKIDNMREEHHEKVIKDAQKAAAQQLARDQAKQAAKAERKDDGFIAVAAGDGLGEIFRGLGVDVVIEGGQTMNPSTEDMLNAIDQVNADRIFILPNNKNIILAANQAQSMIEDKKIFVVPTKTIPQGIAAMISYVPGEDGEENLEHMTLEMSLIKSGQITYAVRDTQIDDKTIKAGDIMGIGDEGILAVGQDVDETALKMLESLVDDNAELISIYYGKDMTETQAQAFAGAVQEKFGGCDVELQYGGQPVYYYVVSVE